MPKTAALRVLNNGTPIVKCPEGVAFLNYFFGDPAELLFCARTTFRSPLPPAGLSGGDFVEVSRGVGITSNDLRG